MQGQYTCNVSLEPVWGSNLRDKQWSNFVGLCRKLASDGLEYEVEPELSTGKIRIRAWPNGHYRPKPVLNRLPTHSLPPILTAEKCRKALTEARQDVQRRREGIRRILQANYQDNSIDHEPSDSGYAHTKGLKRSFGRALAKMQAIKYGGRKFESYKGHHTNPDYPLWDEALGVKVKRHSRLDTRQRSLGWLNSIYREFVGGWTCPFTVQPKYWQKETEPETLLSRATELSEAVANVDYWTTMLELAQAKVSVV